MIDPRAVLTGEFDAAPPKSVTLTVPPALMPALSRGALELGDGDDPMNSWAFGRRGEIFEYRLVGVAATRSGYVGLITAAALAAARAELAARRGGGAGGAGGSSGGGSGASGSASAAGGGGGSASSPLPEWEDFRRRLAAGSSGGGGVRFPSRKHPFLFAGRVVGGAEAAVYTLAGGGGEIAGLLLSSEAAA